MYNLKARIIQCILFAVVVIVIACQDGNLEKISNAQPKADANNLDESGSVAVDRIFLDTVKLYMMTGTGGAVGTVRLEIKSEDGTVIGSSERPVEVISSVSSWITFVMSVPFPTVTQGERYRIEVTRSHPPVTGNGQVYWRIARTNAYAAGRCDVSAVFDYAFRTYAGGVIDQEQTASASVWPLSPTTARWQEFVVRN